MTSIDYKGHTILSYQVEGRAALQVFGPYFRNNKHLFGTEEDGKKLVDEAIRERDSRDSRR